MGAPEDGPCKNAGGLYLALGEFEGKAPNFLDRPTDEFFGIRDFVFFGVLLVSKGRIHSLIPRSEEAHNSSVSSTEAPPLIIVRIMVTHGFRTHSKMQL
jgi:hypothetical protein